ncbi:hypothetical protein AFK68_26720 [Hydrocoleum sp. CS-953]|uniref:hypothetical protein n=1 Tax=Hydrocoleum sp. CS-953 TaxID=1671698 RepID=UPI000B9B10A4|nr:hypothetical protein [Hydrocoleum sp. CS-953]OZH52071.1 hypothetical protein AFK68_26720 [Hydrocoleum sp. CS-953]
METVRKIVSVGSDRQIKISLPETIQPGLVEVVVVMQSLPKSTENLVDSFEPSELFGFLPQRVDALEFQKELRVEWDE